MMNLKRKMKSKGDFVLREKVIDFLIFIGITEPEKDGLLDLIIKNVSYKVLNETNTVLPMAEGLESIAVYMAIGEYLSFKKTSGQLENIDLETAVKQIQQGDTNIQYAIGEGSQTPEQRLDNLITMLLDRENELIKFRRLVW